MRLRLIRNATLLLEYDGRRLLIDPDLASRHARESFTGAARNPMVELPLAVDELIQNVELVVVSHLHRDHFDATEALSRQTPLLCQPGDEAHLRAQGFESVTALEQSFDWNGLHFERTPGHHGLQDVEVTMGSVMGFTLRGAGEPPLYWAGDTVLTDDVRAVLEQVKPSVVVTHSSGAKWPNTRGERELIVMDAAQTLEVCRLAPAARVVAVHLESLDHGTVSRTDLRQSARESGLAVGQLLVPEDGETLTLN